MTRIRRINVSQVEGGGADNLDTNEIRPNGETAFYLDNNDKLTLMMFDGVRTHQKSKVLSPGVLYGSNADAGDGSNADTIKLIPDAALGSDQYIVVDPTGGEPGHIHLRAGGLQDQSGADLYLGAEQTFVRISDTNDNVVIRTSVLGEGVFPYSWIFDNGGKLTLPGTLEYANGTLATGGGLVTPPGTDYIIGTQNLQTVSAQCWPRGGGDNFVADITENDDITVVQEGWTVDIGGTVYTVTAIIGGGGEFEIYATGATFVVGTTYTFTNPIPLAYDWSFGLDGVLSTPGLGTISHQNNDLKVEVTGTDVIVLRTAGGDLVVNSNGNLDVSGDVSIPQQRSLKIDNTLELTSGIRGQTNEVDSILFVNNRLNILTNFIQGNGFQKTWQFDEDGRTTFPIFAAPAHSYGAPGDGIGMVAFDSNYIYYCTAYYTPNSTNLTTLASSGTAVWVDSTDYTGDLVSDFTANSTGWTYNGVTIVSVEVDNQFGPGYLLYGVTGFSTVNGDDYALVNPNTLPNIWKRVAWGADTW